MLKYSSQFVLLGLALQFQWPLFNFLDLFLETKVKNLILPKMSTPVPNQFDIAFVVFLRYKTSFVQFSDDLSHLSCFEQTECSDFGHFKTE